MESWSRELDRRKNHFTPRSVLPLFLLHVFLQRHVLEALHVLAGFGDAFPVRRVQLPGQFVPAGDLRRRVR